MIEALEKLRENTGPNSIFRDIADDIEAEIAERYMELPVDADGVPIHVGDKVQFREDSPVRVDLIGNSRCYKGDWGFFGGNGGFYGQGTLSSVHHIKPRTLKPCPFCGGEAHTYKNNLWHVACENANNSCVTMSAFITEAEAIAAWNTRIDTEYGAIPATEENMRKHGWVRERTCELEPLSAIDVTLNMLDCAGWCKCSNCGHAAPDESNYCPNCGAKVVDE